MANASISRDEVEKFSGLSTSWWDPAKNPLIGMNPIRVNYILDRLRSRDTSKDTKATGPPLSGLNALDVGCGGGLLSESLARLGAKVTAVDPSDALVEAARSRLNLDPRLSDIDYRGGTSIEALQEELNGTDNLFDVICILEVLEHVTDIESLLGATKGLLKPQGTLFISSINRTTKSYLMAIVGAEYITGYVPMGTHTWNQFLSPEEVKKHCSSVGLEEQHVTGMVLGMPPVDGTWRWKVATTDKDVNWIGSYTHADERS